VRAVGRLSCLLTTSTFAIFEVASADVSNHNKHGSLVAWS
jgi:hypothetical protein